MSTSVQAEAYAHVTDIELTGQVPALHRATPDGVLATKSWVLVRVLGEPAALEILDIPVDGLQPNVVEALLIERNRVRLREIVGTWEDEVGLESLKKAIRAIDSTKFSRAHASFTAHAPRCSVVICTRQRPDSLRQSLTSLVTQDHPNFAVWVIDNSPTDNRSREVVESFTNNLNIHYHVEPTPGLSRARNKALRSGLEGEVVAWLDDDELADPLWLSELARAFDGRPNVVAASGAVIPAELITPAQAWFEQFGGHSKGRGFTPDEFSSGARASQDPLYPLPPFGVGANMAFRTDSLLGLGGFDEALGAGSPAQAGEDTKVFTELLRAGGTVAYTPSAVTRHYHRRDLDALRKQMIGYGIGLTAFYTSLILDKPSTMVDLVRLLPRAWRDVSSPDGLRVAKLEEDFPRELLAVNRRGQMAGPSLYIRGRLRATPASRRKMMMQRQFYRSVTDKGSL